MVEAMKIMVTSFKRSHAGIATLSAPSRVAGHHPPRLCWPLLDTHAQVWVSLLYGHRFFLLGLVHTGFCLCPRSVYFPSPV